VLTAVENSGFVLPSSDMKRIVFPLYGTSVFAEGQLNNWSHCLQAIVSFLWIRVCQYGLATGYSPWLGIFELLWGANVVKLSINTSRVSCMVNLAL